MKIMIVDDNQNMREVMKNMLGSLNAEFIECEDGGEAVSQYSQHFPDWVLMDLSMAYVDGITAANQMKDMFPEARIIMVTDYNEKELKDKAKELGAFAYVLKERLHELPVIISSVLQ